MAETRELLAGLVREYKTDADVFHDLMAIRVREILLVATVYDAFILEEEDRLAEQIFGEYYQLNLSTAPRITSVAFGDEALDLLARRSFDLVVLTTRIDGVTPLDLARRIRDDHPALPILLLLNDDAEIPLVPARPRALDRVFVWNGDAKVFLAMIKLVEDALNAPVDTKVGLVRVILLVEDSVRYCSRYLPLLYSEIMRQTQTLIAEERLNEARKLLRMRARPKVLLAESFEEAEAVLAAYSGNLLCVISDVAFARGGARDEQAGVRLVERVRRELPDLPVLIQSADPGNEGTARELGANFMSKHSQSLARELQEFVHSYLGFGDFVFRDRSGSPIARARTLVELRELVAAVSDESLVYHASRNHFSAWLMARGEIGIAMEVQPVRVSDFESTAAMRRHLLDVFASVQSARVRGRVVRFDERGSTEAAAVLRLAEGSLGGKGRGIAFLHMLVEEDAHLVEGLELRVPITAVIGTEEYNGFIERNRLGGLASDPLSDEEQRRRFLAGSLSAALRRKLRLLLQRMRGPLLVRASTTVEAGGHAACYLSNNDPHSETRLEALERAIKLLFASTLCGSSRAALAALGYRGEEQKTAVLIQQAAGRLHGGAFYPSASGLARSYDTYAAPPFHAEDGVAVMVAGLGAGLSAGARAFRFCPRAPRADLLSPEEQLESSQGELLAIDMEAAGSLPAGGPGASLVKVAIGEEEAKGPLRQCVSTWDAANGRLEPGAARPGPKVVNFAPMLKLDAVPLAPALRSLLELLEAAVGSPVEIEFALDLETSAAPTLYLMQIRPLLGTAGELSPDLSAGDRAALLLYSDRAMGHGSLAGLSDVVYVDLESFDRNSTQEMALELDRINRAMRAEGRRYVLIGPGRWGSRDPHLGIPVGWEQISQAALIVETELADYRVDPSYGAHFLQQITSMSLGYASVPYGSETCFIDWAWLRGRRPAASTAHFAHIRCEQPLIVTLDGRSRAAAVRKPPG